jgi:hypothetical protein
MPVRPRFIFHGDAAAFGGRIVRPDDLILESSASSSLPVTGGRSASTSRTVRFGKYVKIGAASTFVEGLFDDVDSEVSMTHGRIHPARLTTTTIVRAEVRDLTVGIEPQFTVKQVRGSLAAKSPRAGGEPAIRLEEDAAFEGMAIGRFRLHVEINRTLFQKYDTRAKLLTAADDARFVREHGDCLFLGAGAPVRPGAPFGASLAGGTAIHGTIVRSIRWEGPAFAGARIDRNTITVPELGTIYLGEIIITGRSRRLTMIRMELGSHVGGSVAFVDVQDNGSWS